jgi:hypothetical protein
MGAPGVDGGNQKARCTKGQYNKRLGAYGITQPAYQSINQSINHPKNLKHYDAKQLDIEIIASLT